MSQKVVKEISLVAVTVQYLTQITKCSDIAAVHKLLISLGPPGKDGGSAGWAIAKAVS